MTRLASLATVLLLCGIASAQVATAPASERLTSGDWTIDVGLAAVSLTPEQKDKFRPLFDASLKEIQDFKDANSEKFKTANEKMKAIREAAKKNGTLDDLPNNQEYQALLAKVTKIQEEETRAAAARHQRLADVVMKDLTSAQKRDFLRRSGLASGDPKYMLQSRAMIVIDHWAPGIHLPDDKFDPLVTRIMEMIKRHETDAADSGETDRNLINQWWAALDKKMKAIIEESLTDEQKTQAAATRQERHFKFIDAVLEGVAAALNRLDPSAEQKAKAVELVAAAREKMRKLDPENREAWNLAYSKLNEDFDRLLTNEQRTKRDTPLELPQN